jgi:hypothetical protein
LLIAISVFLFTTTISGMIATVLIDALVKATDAYTHLERLGYIMVGSTCIPYLLAILCFLRAGKHYSDFKTCLNYCKQATLSNLKIEEFMDMK